MIARVGIGFASKRGMEDKKMNREKMMIALVTTQNDIDHQDILTITAFMTDEQLLEHLRRYTKPVRS